MALTLADKLRIKPDTKLHLIDAPDEFRNFLTQLGIKPTTGTWKVAVPKDFDQIRQIHWFVQNKADMESGLENVIPKIREEVLCWIYFPKGSSGIQTDLNRDTGWEALEHYEQIQFVNLISFDSTWSAFAVRLKSEKNRKKAAPPRADALAEFVDKKAKTVNPPKDFAAALSKSKQAKTFFESLSFTNRKEYVEWIVSAKKEETRKDRLAGTMERLLKQWKNPRNM